MTFSRAVSHGSSVGFWNIRATEGMAPVTSAPCTRTDPEVGWSSQRMVAVRGTHTWEEHRAILDALRRGDSVAASQAAIRHMRAQESAGAVGFSESGTLPG